MAINETKIKDIIAQYKADFNRIDTEERYKWIAVKHFQDNWDIDSIDLSQMIEQSFAKHVNLLDAGVQRPLGLLVYFAKREPENMRSLFKILFNESIKLEQRMDAFTDGVQTFVTKMSQESAAWKSTFQDKHAISVYLTFRFPEKYYIYKYKILKTVAPLLGYELTSDRLAIYREMCDAIHTVAIKDDALITMSHNRLGNECYKDPENRLLAMDIAYFALKLQQKKDEVLKLAAKPSIVLEFKSWLESPTRKNGKPYDYKTIKVYLNQIEDEVEKLIPPYEGTANLFTYNTIAAFKPEREKLAKLIEADDTLVNGAFPKVLKLYEQFLSEREQPTTKPEPILAPVFSRSLYNPEKFLEEVYLTKEDYDSLIDQLIRKKNLILQGPPGVGKTFAALRLVYSLIGEKQSERICFVQFHQSYSYEDFVLGYRATETGFKIADGAFYSFCKKAEKDLDNEWYFIIDEINRGNISKIFGELLMLIEGDKRNKEYAVQLHGADEPFFIPSNVNIIGMMNTADRSIALIDYALRRRFAFYTLKPAFENEGFLDYVESKNCEQLNAVIEHIFKLNDEIAEDPLLGNGFRIGHSYFCTESSVDSKLLRDIIMYEINPLLLEYWVDDSDKVKHWTKNLLDAAK